MLQFIITVLSIFCVVYNSYGLTPLKSITKSISSSSSLQSIYLNNKNRIKFCSTGQHQLLSTPSDIPINEPSSSKSMSNEQQLQKQQEQKGLKQTLKVGCLFLIWYALNIGYNLYNKKVLNMVPELTYTIAFLQLFLGLIYVIPIWGLNIRKAPELTLDEIKTLLPVATLHTLTHIGAVVSLGAGAVSFTHIVKAAEPAVSAFLSAIFLKQFLPIPVYLSLIPVMGGVAMASLTELSFTWLSFISAMISNIASAARGIVGKKSMKKPIGKNMNAPNLYAIMTILSSIATLPLCLLLESQSYKIVLTKIVNQGLGNILAKQIFLSAIFYYLYNEVAFLTLDNVSPVTHALGNTIKRVVIIITSVLVFKTKMSLQGVIGSSIAILGVLLYSLTSNHFKK